MTETETKQPQCLKTNRTELIHTMTNLIEGSDIRLIEDRDDAAMLAIHIVDGLEDQAKRQTITAAPGDSDVSALTCPECGATQRGTTFPQIADTVSIRCGECGNRAALGDFRSESTRLEEALKNYRESRR